MAAESSSVITLGQPSSSYTAYMEGVNNRQRHLSNGVLNEQTMTNGITTDYYHYPLGVADDVDELDLPVSVAGGNWGKKSKKGARWVRRGKAAAWGPSKDEWEAEQRARARLRRMLGPPRSPSPQGLSHLRSPSPPLNASYARALGVGGGPGTHGSYAAFVLDPAMAHSFRTSLLTDVQATLENIAQGEATLTRALGRLWRALSERQEAGEIEESVPKREDGEEEDVEMDERARRLARAPNVTPTVHKLFLTPFPNGASLLDQSQFGSPEMQLENLEKGLGTLRELQDNSREFVERLYEIRESLGDVRRQRDMLWMKVREQASQELQDIPIEDADADEVDETGDL